MLILSLALIAMPAAWAGTPGSFRGYLVEGAGIRPGWVYVQSRNDVLRLVNVASATVSYADEIPLRLRHSKPRESLRPGAEVRVLAEQDRSGNWRAQEIEILRLPPTRRAHK